jgi:hypothetical protein
MDMRTPLVGIWPELEPIPLLNSLEELIGKAARRFSASSVSRACVLHKACIMPNSLVRTECAIEPI